MLLGVTIRPMMQRQCSLSDILDAMPRGSEALTYYATALYGRPSEPTKLIALLAWFTLFLRNEVELIYTALLPRNLTEVCSWPRHPSRVGDVVSFVSFWQPQNTTLWVHRLPGRIPCSTAANQWAMHMPRVLTNTSIIKAVAQSASITAMLQNFEGQHSAQADGSRLLVSRDRDDRLAVARKLHGSRQIWVEVIHSNKEHNCLEDGALWLARAHGSGLWYTPGVNRHILMLRNGSTMDALVKDVAAQSALKDERVQAAARVKCEKFSPALRVELVNWFPEWLLAAARKTQCTHHGGAVPRAFVRSSECGKHIGRGWPPQLCSSCVYDARRSLRCLL